MQQFSAFSLAIIVSLLIVVASLLHALKQHPPYAPDVKAEQQADSGLNSHDGHEGKQGTAYDSPTTLPEIGSQSGCGKCEPKAQHGDEEGTEFWPPLLGYRLKVTDTFVAAFTALLFFATIALWLSTRRLVRGADKTAERQLRAYIGVETVHIADVVAGAEPVIHIIIKNFGNTPAYQVAKWADVTVDELNAADPTFDKTVETGRSVLDPQNIITLRCVMNKPLISADASAIRADTRRLYLGGEVTYIDAFGEPRRTAFRYHTQGQDALDANHMALSDHGNEST